MAPSMYTVLLYGETGVGKSTFINACDNYIKYPTLENALASEKICCRIPIKFAWQNEDYEEVTVQHGSHVNENLDGVGESATQNLNVQYYKYQNKLYRFIDTPGFNDTRGYEAELENVKNMMETVTNGLSDVHALCILLKPDENRDTLRFRYGLMQFLSLFHRNMCRNIIFLYTHSAGVGFRHNTTGNIVRSIIEDIEKNFIDLSIPYGPNNVFLLDNNAFRYLLAVKLEKDSSDAADTYSADWSRSAKACYRLLEYIQTLECRSMYDTLAVNGAKLKLETLQCEEWSRNEEELNILQTKLDTCKSEIERSKKYIERLESSLYDTVITIHEGPYHMICTNKSCAKRDVYSADGKACCPNCKSWMKYFCASFYYNDSQKMYVCRYCGCSRDLHDYLKKTDFKENEKEKNLEVEKMITKEQKLVGNSRVRGKEYSEAIRVLRQKYQIVRNDIAEEVMFLKKNCILPYHKECIDYISMEIDTSTGNKKNRLENHLRRYKIFYDLFLFAYSGQF